MKSGDRTNRFVAFVGRTRELAAIRDAVADAAEGRRRIVALAGPPGIGKTRTVTEACADIEAEGVSTHWVRCSSQAGVPPFWVWEQLIKSVAPSKAEACFDPIKRLYENDSAGYTTGAAQRARFEVFDRVVDCIKTTTREIPLALVIDNLQWADQASLSLLEFLTRQTPDVPLILIITLRTTDIPPGHPASITFGEIIREPGATLFELSGLSVEEIRYYLIDSIEAEPTHELVEAIHTITDGNAFYVTETIRQLPRDNNPDELIRKVREGRTPPSVLHVVATRLSNHSEEMVSILAVAAQAGRNFSRDVLESVCGAIDETTLNTVLNEATDAGIVERQSGDTYRFTHALFQDVLNSRYAPQNLSVLHRRIAEAKEALYSENLEQHALELSGHYRRALSGPWDGRQEFRRKHFACASLAGMQALKTRDFRAAAELLGQALESRDDDTPPDDVVELLKALGTAEGNLLLPSAIERISEATEILKEEGRFSEAARCAVLLPLNKYFDEKAEALVASALELVEQGTVEWALCSAYHHGLQYFRNYRKENYGELKAAMIKALDIVDAVDPFGEDALSIRSIMLVVDGCEIRFDLDDYERTLSACERTGNLSAEIYVLMHGAIRALYFPISVEEARAAPDIIAKMVTTAHRLGDHSALGIAYWTRSNIRYRTGELDQCLLDRARHTALQPGESAQAETLQLETVIALERNRRPEARSTMEELIRRFGGADPSDPLSSKIVGMTVAEWIELTGETHYVHFARKWCEASMAESARNVIERWRSLIATGYLAIAIEDAEAVARIYHEIRMMRDEYPHRIRPYPYIEAKLAAASGATEAAMKHYEENIEFCTATGWTYWRCKCLLEYGILLAGQDDPVQQSKAVSLLEEGLAVARTLEPKCPPR